METKKLHFETLQVHVGQEQADPATDCPRSTYLPDHLLCIPQFRSCSRTFRFARSGKHLRPPDQLHPRSF